MDGDPALDETHSPLPATVPARMLNEHVYCPRLAYLEWVDVGFRDNAETAEGSFVHRRVDAARGRPPETGAPAVDGERAPSSTSVWLSSERLGLSAKIDLLEPRGDAVVPIEYKRGHPAGEAAPLHEPEHVQLCAQALLLRDTGYRVDHAEVYFAETRSRHRVEIDELIVARTLEAIGEIRANASRDEPPPPLVDSPKCPRCSLVGICLPDELGHLTGRRKTPPRRLMARASPAEPLYLTEQDTTLTKRQQRLVLKRGTEELSSVRLIDVAHVSAFGNASIRSSALRACFDAGIPVIWLSYGGWLAGHAATAARGNVELRMRQYRAATVGANDIAARFVAGKIRNARTLLRRHGGADAATAVSQLAVLARRAEDEQTLPSLLGIEGTAARLYFPRFAALLRPGDELGTFEFSGRNRRPPTDPINALFSFSYSMLIKDVLVALLSAGLDPYIGVYHRPKFGRPALALDLAEEFRPLIADSAVLRVVNNGEVEAGDFIARAGAVSLTPRGRKRVIAAYERRLADELQHPTFGYRATYRRSLELQARLLAARLSGETDDYRPLTTR